MSFYSPLRYPGGKKRLATKIEKIARLNNINGSYIEPYAGGAAVALHLLLTNTVSEIIINDADVSVYSFWNAVLNDTAELCELIEKTPVTIDEWRKQHEIFSNETYGIKLAFSALFMNRTNFSGILKGGPIGGKNQSGKYKIDCRFNKSMIIDKINLIAKQKRNIKVTNLDALDLLETIPNNNSNILIYIDPPYYIKGKFLYLNSYRHGDHLKVAEAIKKLDEISWILSYDNTTEIQELYKEFNSIQYKLHHSAGHSKQGSEIIFFSDNIKYSDSLFL